MCKKLQLLKTLFPSSPAGAVPLDPTEGLESSEHPDWPVFIIGLSGGNSPKKLKKFLPPKKFDETEEPEARIHGWVTLTKMLVPICFYCLNCTKFGRLILRKIVKIVATRCQILRLNAPNSISTGAPPQTHWGSLQRFPRPTSLIWAGLLLRAGRRKEKKGTGGERKGREWRGEEGIAPFWNPKYATVVYCTKNDLRGEIVQNPNFAPTWLASDYLCCSGRSSGWLFCILRVQ